MEILKPILDPFNKISLDAFSKFVRKAAHFTEFMVLGLLCSGFFLALGIKTDRKFIALPYIIPFATAVCDEILQTFVDGRAGMLTDVFIDTAGALTGILILGAVYKMISNAKNSV